MSAYDTNGLTRILQHDVAHIYSRHSYLDGASLVALERQRDWRTVAETRWLLEQHGVLPVSVASVVTELRRSIGTALVRAGQYLTAASPHGATPQTSPVAGIGGVVS